MRSPLHRPTVIGLTASPAEGVVKSFQRWQEDSPGGRLTAPHTGPLACPGWKRRINNCRHFTMEKQASQWGADVWAPPPSLSSKRGNHSMRRCCSHLYYTNKLYDLSLASPNFNSISKQVLPPNTTQFSLPSQERFSAEYLSSMTILWLLLWNIPNLDHWICWAKKSMKPISTLL